MIRKCVVFGCLVLLMCLCTWSIGRAADNTGQALYDGTCGECHGPAGRDGKAPKLVPFRWSDQEALALVRSPLCDMPPISESDVSDGDLAEIIAYLRTIN